MARTGGRIARGSGGGDFERASLVLRIFTEVPTRTLFFLNQKDPHFGAKGAAFIVEKRTLLARDIMNIGALSRRCRSFGLTKHNTGVRVPFSLSAHEKPVFVVGSLFFGLCRVFEINLASPKNKAKQVKSSGVLGALQ